MKRLLLAVIAPLCMVTMFSGAANAGCCHWHHHCGHCHGCYHPCCPR